MTEISSDFKSSIDEFLDRHDGGLANSTTFADNMKIPVHRWFRYSAGFSAEWATHLIRHWQSRAVFDPFAGAGTTVLAAQEQHVPSAGAEVHPMVSRIANTKLLWTSSPAELRDRAAQLVDRAKTIRDVEVPSAHLVAKCFPDAQSLETLLRLRDAVLQQPNDDVAEITWLAFLSIIRACSPAGTAQWQYILPNKRKARVAEPVEAFISACEMFANDMEARQFVLGSNPSSAKIQNIDARTLETVEDGSFDTVVTSPPYANNYDYADTLRLELILMGEINGWRDLKPLRGQLLKSATQNVGGWNPTEALSSKLLSPIIDELLPVFEELSIVKKERGGHKNYDVMLAGYFFDNAEVFQALRKKLVPGGRVCYVVGDSAPYGVHAPVERWLGELAVSVGFKGWSFTKVRDRNTKWRNRKHTHPLHEGYLWIEG